MSSNKCIVRVSKLKESALRVAYEHNERIAHVNNADLTKSHLNVVLAKEEGKTYRELALERIKDLPRYEDKKVRKDAIYGVEVMMTFSPEAVKELDIERWSKDSLHWARDFFKDPVSGKDNLIGAVLHMDEGTPHIHAVFVPEVDGGLNAKALVGNAGRMAKMQTSYAEVMKAHGLQRGRNTKEAHLRHITPRDFHAMTLEAYEGKVPEKGAGESFEAYAGRLKSVIFGLVEENQRNLIRFQGDLRVARQYAPSTELARENARLQKEIRTYRRERDELIREFGDMKSALDMAKSGKVAEKKLSDILNEQPNNGTALSLLEEMKEARREERKKEREILER